MKLKTTFLLSACLLLGVISTYAQQNAVYTAQALSYQEMPSLASRTALIPYSDKGEEAKDRRSVQNDIIIGKGLPNGDDPLTLQPNRLKNKYATRTPSLVFDTAESTSQPTDPAGAVGPDHYVAVYNTGFQIFDKDGNSLTGGQVDAANIFPIPACCDLTASYDAAADRYVLSILGNPLAASFPAVQFAVSQGPDPVNDGWHTFVFPMVTDYQKVSVWSDGYYMTANNIHHNNGEPLTPDIFVVDREKMLEGDPTAAIVGLPLAEMTTDGFHSPQALNISNSDYPGAGDAPIVFFQDDAYSGVDTDHLLIWNVNVNWTLPLLSTISEAQVIETTPFTSVFDGGSFANLQQPDGGQLIDAIQGTVMNQAQYRRFPTHNSMVFNFVVDTDGSADKVAGIRWYELRQANDGDPWQIYQEGTYTAPDNKHAWMGSMIMDKFGNIGLGYSGMGGDNDQFVSTYYTGRFANDPINVMTVAETVIKEGDGNIPGTANRYGDYSKIDIDPADDETFWFVNELFEGVRKNTVGVFKLIPEGPTDVGVIDIESPTDGILTNAETVTVTVRNYGTNPISNVPVSFSVDGTEVANEIISDIINPQQNVSYTFTATADLSVEGTTYSLGASTVLQDDEEPSNDAFTKDVTHLVANDIGVTEITAPSTGGLSSEEVVTITIENFGAAPQANFPVAYTIDENIAGAVTEIVNSTLQPGASMSYSFTQTADLDDNGNYTIEAGTLLANDADNSNNAVQKFIENTLGIDEVNSSNLNMQILSKGSNLFSVTLNTQQITNTLRLTVTNIQGQTLLVNDIENNGTGYNYDLDMSHAATGVYIITLGDGTQSVSKKLIVR